MILGAFSLAVGIIVGSCVTAGLLPAGLTALSWGLAILGMSGAVVGGISNWHHQQHASKQIVNINDAKSARAPNTIAIEPFGIEMSPGERAAKERFLKRLQQERQRDDELLMVTH
jgi:hypothetical protein